MIDYKKKAKSIFEQNKAVGWWDEKDRCKLTLLQLISTEIAEATEAERKDLMDDHLPHRKGGEVELADAMIRALDMGGAYGWNYFESINIDHKSIMDSVGIAGKHHYLNCSVCLIGSNIEDKISPSGNYSLLLDSIAYVAESQGYDLEGALYEKLKYNAERQDHKRSERAKKNGKKF